MTAAGDVVVGGQGGAQQRLAAIGVPATLTLVPSLNRAITGDGTHPPSTGAATNMPNTVHTACSFVIWIKKAAGGSSLGLFRWEASYPNLYLGGDTSYAGQTIPTVGDGAWHQIVLTSSDPATQGSIYVDGTLASSALGGLGVSGNALGTLYIGGDNSQVNCWAGSIAKPAIFNKVLTAQNIADLYNAAITNGGHDALVLSMGPARFFPENEATGTVCVDATAVGNLTYAAQTTIAQTGPVVAGGNAYVIWTPS